MTDYNWLSPGVVEAATDGIRAEANKWYGLSDEMATVARTMAGLTLEPTAFAVLDVSTAMTMADQHGAYATTHGWLSALFVQATRQFSEMGDALRKCADEYDRTEGRSAASFDRIARS